MLLLWVFFFGVVGLLGCWVGFEWRAVGGGRVSRWRFNERRLRSSGAAVATPVRPRLVARSGSLQLGAPISPRNELLPAALVDWD